MAEVQPVAQALEKLSVEEPARVVQPECPQNGQEEGHDSGVDESTQAKVEVSGTTVTSSSDSALTLQVDLYVMPQDTHQVPPTTTVSPQVSPRTGVLAICQENGQSRSPSKGSRGSPKKRMPRSSDPSPMKQRTPQSATSAERKAVPMNKVEVGKTASPNLKAVKSKIGSMDNASYRPGGGKIKIETKKLDYSKASSKVVAKNVAYTPGGGDKKIESQKLKWNVTSKVGSLDNKDHKPGGGDKKIESQKVAFKAQSKIGSRENIKHKPGGGEIQIETKKLDFKEKASSKVGSLNNVQHKAGGGEKKIFDDKDYLRQMQGSPCKTPTSKASSEANLSRTQSPSPGLMSPTTQVKMHKRIPETSLCPACKSNTLRLSSHSYLL